MEIAQWLVSALAPGIIVGVVMAYWNRRQNRQDTSRREKDALQVEGDMLRLDLVVASAQLAHITALALTGGKLNGNVEEALEKYNTAMDKFRKFERKQMAMRSHE